MTTSQFDVPAYILRKTNAQAQKEYVEAGIRLKAFKDQCLEKKMTAPKIREATVTQPENHLVVEIRNPFELINLQNQKAILKQILGAISATEIDGASTPVVANSVEFSKNAAENEEIEINDGQFDSAAVDLDTAPINLRIDDQNADIRVAYRQVSSLLTNSRFERTDLKACVKELRLIPGQPWRLPLMEKA